METIFGKCVNPAFIALRRRIFKRAGEATRKFKLIEEGDRILIGFSGGKDSFVLVDYLHHLRLSRPGKFQIEAAMVDMNFPEEEVNFIRGILEKNSIPFHLIPSKIPSIVTGKMENHKNACVLCSRLRRGLLYSFAREHRFNKLALGHNADDVIETLLLNLFYNGKIKAMSPRFLNDDGDLIVIRPLYYVMEEDTRAYARELNWNVINNPCPLQKFRGEKREIIKKILKELEEDFPAVKKNIIRSLEKIEKRFLPPPPDS